VVKLYADGGTWWIRNLAGNPTREEIDRIGNRWAQRFASGNSCFHMNQPLCERIDCVHVGGVRIKNCTPLTAAFQESFEEATVQDIVIRKGYRAAAMFSNGEVITLHADAGAWWIEKLGGNAARQFFE
jgi:hypothetical protein